MILQTVYTERKSKAADSYDRSGKDEEIKDDNIGNRMLQRMGWTAGQGLGKDNKGRRDIITVKFIFNWSIVNKNELKFLF